MIFGLLEYYTRDNIPEYSSWQNGKKNKYPPCITLFYYLLRFISFHFYYAPLGKECCISFLTLAATFLYSFRLNINYPFRYLERAISIQFERLIPCVGRGGNIFWNTRPSRVLDLLQMVICTRLVSVVYHFTIVNFWGERYTAWVIFFYDNGGISGSNGLWCCFLDFVRQSTATKPELKCTF